MIHECTITKSTETIHSVFHNETKSNNIRLCKIDYKIDFKTIYGDKHSQ